MLPASVCDWIQHYCARWTPPPPALWGPHAETGLQMAFDDFVIERNLVSCLRTNEVDRGGNGGREEYRRVQIRGGRKTLRNNSPSGVRTHPGVLESSCHRAAPPHRRDNNRITMQNRSSGLLHSVKAECVGGGNKPEDRWR